MAIKKITITEEELKVISYHAEQLHFCGISRIREKEDRRKNLEIDQLTGQLGEAALSKLLTGSIDLYDETRKRKEEHLRDGDDGSDLIGYRVDVKTSRARMPKGFLYHLMVRDREYHPDVMYYHAMIPMEKNDAVYFTGTMMGNELPKSVDGKRTVRMDKLHPIK